MAATGQSIFPATLAEADSHFAACRWMKRSEEAIRASDLQPFAGLAAERTASCPRMWFIRRLIGCQPGFSRRWLQDILRQELGFQRGDIQR